MNNKAKHPMYRPAFLRMFRRDLFELMVCIALAALFVLLSSGAAFAQGNVGINNAAPHAKSLLDLTSSDKGLLAPRMTAAQRIAMFPVADATAKGMLVYQTDGAQGFHYYDGAAWVMVQNGGAGWSLTGNAGTNPGTHFLGTTDAQPLAIGTNGAERVRIATSGNVGIGMTPLYNLDLHADNQAVARFNSGNAANGTVVELKNSMAAANTFGAINFNNAANSYAGQLAYHATEGMTFRSGGFERMRLSPVGCLGLGMAPLYNIDMLAPQSVIRMNTELNPNGSVIELKSSLAGSNTLGAINFNNAANSYAGQLAYHATDGMAFRSGGFERMRIAPDGNVGIGTAAPMSKLQVSRNPAGYAPNPGSALTVEGSGAVYSSILSSNNETGLLFGASNDPQNGGIIYNPSWLPNGMVFRSGGNATHMSINPNGAVTVSNNTNWPAYPFGVSKASPNSAPVAIRNLDDSGIGGVHYFGSGGSLGGVTGWNNNGNPMAPNSLVHGTLSNNPATFVTNSVERMRIAPDGNVGIGTITPGRKLDVVDAGSGLVARFKGTNPAGYSILHILRSDDVGAHLGFFNPGIGGPLAGNFVMGSFGNAPVSLTVNNNECMRIATSGNVGIGTNITNVRLQVAADQPDVVSNLSNANANGYGGMHFDNNSGGRAHVGFAGSTAPFWANMGYTGTASAHPFVLTTSNAERMRIAANGNVGVGTNAPTTKLEVNGFTKLGTDAPAIKMKKLTGTTGATEGSTASIAHGLTVSKIIGVQVLIEYSTNNWIPTGYTINPEYQADYAVGVTNITVYNQSTNSGLILSKPVKILVTYEE